MNAFALHIPERPAFSRWILAAAVIIAAHAGIIASIALWYVHQAPEPNILPAIAVSLAPVDASSPEIQDQDIAVGPTMQQAEEQPKEQPKVEDKPIEPVVQPPPPQQQAEVTLPAEQPKEVEKPKQEYTPPAPETRAPPKTEHIGQFSQAASNKYNALVFGHLQRFKRYPAAAHGAAGTAVVRFVLDRRGQVLRSEVTKSSGSTVLDQEAIAILHRASPFPAFPAAKPGEQDVYIAPVNFGH
ncbi:energy transducer TonB [Bradyrhizobium sp. STM 3562]|uniref:energy transducer TonB n=1 Tax=Bradyrhizobium sp. STM 3562 TaxID=578924 RepID=UPI00388FD2AB